MRTRSHRAIVVFLAVALALASAVSPARAQLNNQRIQTDMERRAREAAPPPNSGSSPNASSQGGRGAAVSKPLPVRIEGKVLEVKDGVLTVEQPITAFGETTMVRSRFVTTPATKVAPADFKPGPGVRVKLQYIQDPDGKRRVLEIAPVP